MPSCDCLTGCAHTYREARAEHKEKEAELAQRRQQEELLARQRKPKSFCVASLVVLPDPLEGEWRQVGIFSKRKIYWIALKTH